MSVFLLVVIPYYTGNPYVNLNKTTTKEGNTVEMICQSEGKPDPKMYFQRKGDDKPYSSGAQLVREKYLLTRWAAKSPLSDISLGNEWLL